LKSYSKERFLTPVFADSVFVAMEPNGPNTFATGMGMELIPDISCHWGD